MRNTKEDILAAALHLFAQKGYEAVSVSDIAGAMGMTKGALYKHYVNKQNILDSIIARMEELDRQRAEEFQLPEGTPEEMEEAYAEATWVQLAAFCKAQLRYWTEEDFPSCFRKMLTLEQYRDEKMGRLYGQYLVFGPLSYVTDLFAAWDVTECEKKASELYSAMFLYYSVYDGSREKPVPPDEQIDRLLQGWKTNIKGEKS